MEVTFEQYLYLGDFSLAIYWKFNSPIHNSFSLFLLACKLFKSDLQIMYLILDMSEVLDNKYLISLLTVTFVCYISWQLDIQWTRNFVFWDLDSVEILVLWQKNVQNLLIYAYLFCPHHSRTGSKRTFITWDL